MCIPFKAQQQPEIFAAPQGNTGSSATSNSSTKKRGRVHLIVQHNYHDRSCEAVASNSGDVLPIISVKGTNSAPFPVKLYEMLEIIEKDGLSHIISWQPHGRCFVIHKPHEFAAELLPKYMNLGKIASFQRQLNLYGFGRITTGADRGAYFHECFLRYQYAFLRHVHRIKVKGTGVRAKANPQQEPNFWIMPWITKDGIVDPQTDSQQQEHVKPEDEQSTFASASVISREDMEQDYVQEQHEEEQEEELVAEGNRVPLPDIPQSSFEMLTEDEQDVVLTEWGMPFHALDKLPAAAAAAAAALGPKNTLKPLPPPPSLGLALSTDCGRDAPTSWFELDDQVYLDQMLNTMFARDEKFAPEDDLLAMLEKVVSS